MSTSTCAPALRETTSSGGGDAVHLGHLEVHQHDVGAELADAAPRPRGRWRPRRPPRCPRRRRAAPRARAAPSRGRRSPDPHRHPDTSGSSMAAGSRCSGARHRMACESGSRFPVEISLMGTSVRRADAGRPLDGGTSTSAALVAARPGSARLAMPGQRASRARPGRAPDGTVDVVGHDQDPAPGRPRRGRAGGRVLDGQGVLGTRTDQAGGGEVGLGVRLAAGDLVAADDRRRTSPRGSWSSTGSTKRRHDIVTSTQGTPCAAGRRAARARRGATAPPARTFSTTPSSSSSTIWRGVRSMPMCSRM